jgi:hypothetical protein
MCATIDASRIFSYIFQTDRLIFDFTLWIYSCSLPSPQLNCMTLYGSSAMTPDLWGSQTQLQGCTRTNVYNMWPMM